MLALSRLLFLSLLLLTVQVIVAVTTTVTLTVMVNSYSNDHSTSSSNCNSSSSSSSSSESSSNINSKSSSNSSSDSSSSSSNTCLHKASGHRAQAYSVRPSQARHSTQELSLCMCVCRSPTHQTTLSSCISCPSSSSRQATLMWITKLQTRSSSAGEQPNQIKA